MYSLVVYVVAGLSYLKSSSGSISMLRESTSLPQRFPPQTAIQIQTWPLNPPLCLSPMSALTGGGGVCLHTCVRIDSTSRLDLRQINVILFPWGPLRAELLTRGELLQVKITFRQKMYFIFCTNIFFFSFLFLNWNAFSIYLPGCYIYILIFIYFIYWYNEVH